MQMNGLSIQFLRGEAAAAYNPAARHCGVTTGRAASNAIIFTSPGRGPGRAKIRCHAAP